MKSKQPQIKVERFFHRNQMRLGLHFAYDLALIGAVKKIASATFSKAHKGYSKNTENTYR
jgi:hypothetical protein